MRRPSGPGFVPGFVLVVVVVVLGFPAACGDSSSDPTFPDPSGPEDPADPDPDPGDPSSPWALTVAETAEALRDPDRVEDGVRSVLANLGVGVYTANGTQVFAGSETSAADFWLYDFEIPALARGALEDGHPFIRLADAVAAVGVAVEAEGLLVHFRDAYAAHPEAFLAALLDQSDLSLEGSPEAVHLTPFQEWLLLLDAFVPTPSASGSAGSSSALGSGSGLRGPAGTTGCGGIQGGGLTPGWGIAGPPAALPPGADPTLMVQLVALRQMFAADVQLSDERAHHLHPGGNHDVPSHSMTITAVVGFRGFPGQVIPCRPDLWAVLTSTTPGADGIWGIPEVSVEWDLSPDFFEEHGRLETAEGTPWFPGLPAFTGFDGRVDLHFTAKDEESRGVGLETEDARLVSATFDVGSRLQQLFPIEYPALISSFIEPVHHSIPQLFTVEWHEGLEMELWAGWSTDAIAWEMAALAGAFTVVGHGPEVVARSPATLPELFVGSCGFYSRGLELEGLEGFYADASAGGQTAWMQTTVEHPEDEFAASIEFLGHARGTAVDHIGSFAEAATEAVDEWSFDPAVYVFNIENPGADTLQFRIDWEYEGEVAGEPEYSQWWVDAFLRVRSCDGDDGGPDSDWEPFLGYDDEFPGPGSGAEDVWVTEEFVQVHLLLSAGALANAVLRDDMGLPPLESSASVNGSLTVSLRSIHDPGVALTSATPTLSRTSAPGLIERKRPPRRPR
jgi:hypothetical protein